MSHTPKQFTIADPRQYDGTPFEVAERAVAQLEGLVALTQDALGPAKVIARNAELERQCLREEEPDAVGWPETPEGRRWALVEAKLAALKRDFGTLRRAAAFNPRARP